MTTAKRTLQLNLERKHFDRVALGTKTKEYRKQTVYWATRLEGRDYDTIIFRNGYGPKVPEIEVEFKGVRKTTREREPVYAIKLGKILSKKRWTKPTEDS